MRKSKPAPPIPTNRYKDLRSLLRGSLNNVDEALRLESDWVIWSEVMVEERKINTDDHIAKNNFNGLACNGVKF
ncbi:MAG: hypothetical protein AAGF26_05210 [Cyanobacteria bacterium P01_G01_bin.49]